MFYYYFLYFDITKPGKKGWITPKRCWQLEKDSKKGILTGFLNKKQMYYFTLELFTGLAFLCCPLTGTILTWHINLCTIRKSQKYPFPIDQTRQYMPWRKRRSCSWPRHDNCLTPEPDVLKSWHLSQHLMQIRFPVPLIC